MILHGIEAPNITHTNTLSEKLSDIQEKDRFDIVLANPPFGGNERAEVQQNFPIKTSETAFLFLQHFIKMLKAGGKAGVVIKDTFLSNTDNAAISLRRELLENCNLHTILDLPGGTFQGAGVKTVVLFFEKGSPTRKIWFYQLNLDRNLGKTHPLNENDLKDFLLLQQNFIETSNSWIIDLESLDLHTFDLSVKNPHKKSEILARSPQDIINKMITLDIQSAEVLQNARNFFLQSISSNKYEGWSEKKLGEFLKLEYGKPLEKSKRNPNGKYPAYGANGILDRTNEFHCDKPSIIVGRKGSAGEVTLTEEKFWPLDVTYFVTFDRNQFDLKFIYNLLKYLDLPRLAKGVKPGINRNDVYSIPVTVPSLSEQKRIVNQLEDIFCKTRNLEIFYRQQLLNIKQFNESLLENLLKDGLRDKLS